MIEDFLQQRNRRFDPFHDELAECPPHAGERLRAVGFVHDQLAVFWKELNVPHLDLLPVFRDSASKTLTVNRFDAHPNETAHALAGAAIGKFLASQMLTNRPGF